MATTLTLLTPGGTVKPNYCLRPGTHLVCVADDSPARMAPKPLGAADTPLEAGEEPTDLSPTPLAGLHGGPGFHPDQD